MCSGNFQTKNTEPSHRFKGACSHVAVAGKFEPRPSVLLVEVCCAVEANCAKSRAVNFELPIYS